MAQGLFNLKQQLQGLIQKAWYGNTQPTAPSFSSYAGSFNGSSQYLSLSDTANLELGSGNFTIEAYINTSWANTSATAGILTQYDNAGSAGTYIFGVRNNVIYCWDSGTSYPGYATVSNVGWVHVAWVRNGSGTNNNSVYVNGALDFKFTNTTNFTGASQPIQIGRWGTTANMFPGFISNLRIVKGTAVYTSNFIPTGPLTAISGTQLLTLQNATIIDNSTNGYSITNNGSVATTSTTISSNIPLSANGNSTPAVEYLVVAGGGAGGGGAAYSGGGGGAGGLLQGVTPVTTGTSLTVTVGTGGTGTSGHGTNGTNSVFAQITAIGGGGGTYGYTTSGFDGGSGGGGGSTYTPAVSNLLSNGVLGQGNGGGSNQFGGNGSGGGAGSKGLSSYNTSNGVDGGAGSASAISGTLTPYAGGGASGSSYAGGTFSAPGGAGGGGRGAYYDGATATTATSGTANTGGGGGGGCNGTGCTTAGSGGSGIVIISYPDIYSAPASFGGANSPTASTSGSGSVYLSGSANYGTIGANTNWTFLHDGTTDWTYEFFAYFSDVTSTQFFSGTSNVSSQPGCYFYISTNKLWFQIAGNNYVGVSSNAGALPSTNTWYQIAYTYTASTKTINFYVNGTSVGSGSFGVTMDTRTATYPLGLGHDGGADYWNGGYITNLRISKIKRTTVTNTQSVPFSADASTYYLLNAVSGAYLADSSGTGLTMTTTGSVVWNQLSPFATGLGYKNRVYTWTGNGTVTF